MLLGEFRHALDAKGRLFVPSRWREELTGNVVVTRGADILRGHRLMVDLTSGVSKMDQGRVEGLFQTGSRTPEKK